MKIAFVPKYGSPEVVELREVPTPEPGPGQVRVAVRATAVTTGDWRLRSGVLPEGFGWLRGPVLGFGGPRKGVLGSDAAGLIDAVGPGVTEWKVGDEVVAFPGSAMGGHAEALIMPADGRIARKPARLSFEEAVALPFGGMTALDVLRRGGLKAGERVLVNGASGSVGSAAVQIAKNMGAHVTAVCSARNAELVRGLGADVVLDYQRADFAAGEARYDVIMDTVGNAPYERVRPVLNQGGRLLLVMADLAANLAAPFVGGKQRHRVVAGPVAERPEDLRALVALAEQGAVRPVIDQRFPFERIVEAYRIVDSGRKRGSVVLSLGAGAA